MGFRGNGAAVVIGTVIALYGAFGVAQALQNAMNVIWSIPRHRRPNPVTARLRSLVLIGIAGLAVLATTAIPALGGSAGAGDVFGGWLAPLVTTLAVVVNSVVFITVFQISLASETSVRDVAPGAVAAGVNLADAASVRNRRRIEHREGLERHLRSVCTRSGSDGRVVPGRPRSRRERRDQRRANKHLFPRAFLTWFTDTVDLTHADQRAYTARAERGRANHSNRPKQKRQPASCGDARRSARCQVS